MFTSRLQKNVSVRAIICLVLFSVADVLLIKDKWFVLLGLAIGTGISIMKFESYAWIFSNEFKLEVFSSSIKQSVGIIVVFALNQIVLFSALLFSYLHNPWTFIGLAGGVLSVPLVLLVNSVTEFLGITKNSFFV